MELLTGIETGTATENGVISFRPRISYPKSKSVSKIVWQHDRVRNTNVIPDLFYFR